MKFWLCIISLIGLTACQTGTPSPSQSPSATTTQTTLTSTVSSLSVETQAEVSFVVQVPKDTVPGAAVRLNILDIVTGLNVNPYVVEMKKVDDSHYTAKAALRLHSTISYRYSLNDSSSSIEKSIYGEPIQFRLLLVDGPSTVQDIISRWSGAGNSDQTGNISGVVSDDVTHSPIPGLLVVVGGQQVFTSSNGSFSIMGLPEGTHNLVVAALDGSYSTFQQGARVAAGLTTPAHIVVHSLPRVNVTFRVAIPKENVVGLPVRMAGNLLNLGNTYGNDTNGMNTLASRMPLLTQLPDNRYQLTLSLPSGAELEYKYTLGDGFWDSELTQDGRYFLRKLTVPAQDITIDDQVDSWHSPGYGSITFDLTVPAETPAGETISIQFKPFGWTNPLPMWSMGNNRYIFILDNPLNFAEPLDYRFCRNDQCGTVDNAVIAGAASAGGNVTPGSTSVTVKKVIAAWDDWETIKLPTTVAAADIVPHGEDFMAGVEFIPAYSSSWLPVLAPVYQNLHSIGVNWIILTPTWSFQSAEPQLFNPVAGNDMLWFDSVATINNARNAGLNVAVFPSIHSSVNPSAWWASASRSADWWDRWFAQYRLFIIHHADLAAQTGAKALIIGGDWLSPALPGGMVSAGVPSNVPSDADQLYRTLVSEVRTHFSGSLLWAIDYSDIVNNVPSFLDAVDAIYLEFSPPLTESKNPSQDSLNTAVSTILDNDIKPILDLVNKPIILAAGYPSVEGAAANCVEANDQEGLGCILFGSLDRVNLTATQMQPDLQIQVDIYNALFSAINSRSWIKGFVSRGFYPPVVIQDSSNSINGKPAMDLLWYWFPKLTQPQ